MSSFARSLSQICASLIAPTTRAAKLIINLPSEAAPEVLVAAVREALGVAAGKFGTLKATLDHLEHFRPGKPTSTHRFYGVVA